MKNVFRTIVMIALGCVLFGSTAAARGHRSGGGGTGMGGGGSMGGGGGNHSTPQRLNPSDPF